MHTFGSFTIGICASDSAKKLPAIFDVINEETKLTDLRLERIIVVASGCHPSVRSFLNRISTHDNRVTIISEEKRHGKAEAINKILELCQSEFLILINSDAVPERGSIAKLLGIAVKDKSVGTVSASPLFYSSGGTTFRILELMWCAHNLSSSRLNHISISNHASDELILVRRRLISRIPEDIINDGAYIGGIAYSKGYKVKFSDSASVKIDVPRTVFHLLQQRRRIVFGHLKVWKVLGLPPRTIKSLLIMKPRIALGILINLFSHRPVLIYYAPLAAIIEFIATLLAITDWFASEKKHVVWRRYSDS